jgi:GNAT superfamily N-acetyltransferase
VTSPTITIVEAGAEHFADIAEIERASGRTSPVTLTNGLSLQESLDRGHWVAVAVGENGTRGWIWFTVELDRGGEYTGVVMRIGVTSAMRRGGVGRQLMDYADSVFHERGVVRVRATVDGDSGDAEAFFGAVGFSIAAVMLERQL